MAATRWTIAISLATLAAGMPARADTVTWLSSDFPPLTLPGNPPEQRGYMDMLLLHLQRTMPQHTFHEDIVPWPRALFLAQSNGSYCTAMAAQTPERETYLRFTAPYGYVYPVGVVVRGDDDARFRRHLNKDGELRLRDALRDPQLRLGLASSRSYGTQIDRLLQPLIRDHANQVLQVSQDNSTRSLISMLGKKRFDYTLAYPTEATYYGGHQEQVRFYPVAGNSELLPGRFSCTKSPQTDRVFEDLRRAVGSVRSSALLESYERWLPANLVRTYRQRLARQLATHP